MRVWCLTVVSAVAISLAGAGPSGAQDVKKDDGFAKRLFARNIDKQKKSYVCFLRRYDAAHLAGHPLQKVSVMRLLVTAERIPEDDALNYSFRLGLKFRDKPGDFDSSGDCGHGLATEGDNKGRLYCGVDCDGGGISVELPPANTFLLVRLEFIRIWNNNKPDDDGFSLSGGADDKVFRLERTNLADCASLVTDREELAALRRKP